MTDLRAAALAYAGFGFPVFPVALDKTPLTPHGFKDATTDAEQIARWWAEFPGAGIGVPTGAGTGVVVLDEDPRHGGAESLAAMVAERGPLPDAPVARTGGGGRHFWFRHPGGAFPSVAGFRPGLDTRGDGGYVVVPPSPHPSGTPYSWVVDPGEAALALPPPWLLEEMERRRSAAAPRFEAGAGGRIPHGRHHEFIVQTAASLASRVAGVSESDLLRSVGAVVRETLDDAAAHDREVSDAVRSALAKYGRPAPPESRSTRAESDGVPGHGGRHPDAGTSDSGPGRRSPTSAVGRVEAPADLFILNHRTGERRPDPAAFAGWFRRSETFVVPTERGTFSTGGNFDLLRYEGGYYNGMARSYVRGRTEDAFRAVGLASADGFREEVVRAIGATSEFHRRRETFNPPGLLCLENGVLDTETGVVGPHSPDVVFTWRMPVAYDPAATCPRFDRFLEEVMPDARRRDLLVDLMGYCLRRDNPHHLFFVLVGDGANGKTTFGRVLGALLGGDAVSTLSLQQIGSNRFSGAELDGRLLNLCDDLPFDRPLAATGVLKTLTGAGSLTVERKHGHPFELRFGGKLVSMANRLPPTEDDTYAFWRRAVVMSFDQVFELNGPRTDPFLFDKIAAELPGVLNLALRGLARVRSRGNFDPGGLLSGSEDEWRRRADPVRAELLEDFEACPGAFVTNARIRDWHAGRSDREDREPLSDRALGEAFLRAFPASRPARKQVHGRAVWGRPGIRERVASPGLGGVAGSLTPPTGPETTGAAGRGLQPGDGDSTLAGAPSVAGLAGFPHIGLGEFNPGTGGKENTPANPATGSPPGPAIGPLIPLPETPCRSESDGPPRERHRNCPICVSIEHHVCESCPACRWAMNNPDPGGGP